MYLKIASFIRATRRRIPEDDNRQRMFCLEVLFCSSNKFQQCKEIKYLVLPFTIF
jgi:hypothetical protein